MHIQDVDVTALAAAAAETTKRIASEKSLELAVELGGEPLMVRGDRARLQQIVSGLLWNAVERSDAGGTISMDVRRSGESAVIVVGFAGAGLEPGEEQKIFETPLPGVASSEHADGSGAGGLARIRALVQLHDGRISAESAGRDRSVTFTVTLPLAAGRASGKREIPRRSRAEGGLSIVIVEDNDDSREMLQLLLERRGHRVVVARDGKEGVAAIIERCPDLALVDIGLPAMNGYDVARQVRAARPDAPIYMVALTGYGRSEDHEAVMLAGFDEHIVKPIKPEEIERLTGSFEG